MSFIDEKYFFDGDLFNGIAFSIQTTGHVEAHVMKDGVAIRPYRSICLPDNKTYSQVDLTPALALEESEYMHYFKFKNNVYTGVGYFFEGDFCDGECFVENSITCSNAFWWPNGEIQSYDATNLYFTEMYEWYSSGDLKKITISPTNTSLSKYHAAIELTEKNEIKKLVAGDGFFETISYVALKSKLPPGFGIFDFLKKKWASQVFLAGSDIDFELIDKAYKNESLLNVSSIEFSTNSIIDLDFDKFPNLKELKYFLQNSDANSLNKIENLKKINVKINFYLNGVKL